MPYVIRVMLPGKKRAVLLTPKGGTTRLLVHATRYENLLPAESLAKAVETLNPGVKAKPHKI